MDEKRHVRKSNIFAQGRYRLGLNEQRILLAIISKIAMSDTDFKDYRLDWSEIRKVTRKGVSTQNQIQKVCEVLKNKTVYLKQGSVTHGFGFLSGWTLEEKKYVDFRIDPRFKDHLLDLLLEGHFMLCSLESLVALPSSYSIRLYEILKSQEFKKVFEVSLEQLRWSLGVPQGSLSDSRFDKFNDTILKPAQKAIAANTDILFTYEKILQYRQVDSLRFTVSKNPDKKSILKRPRKKSLRNNDQIVFEGVQYEINHDHIQRDDGVIAIGDLNSLYRDGRIQKLNKRSRS